MTVVVSVRVTTGVKNVGVICAAIGQPLEKIIRVIQKWLP